MFHIYEFEWNVSTIYLLGPPVLYFGQEGAQGAQGIFVVIDIFHNGEWEMDAQSYNPISGGWYVPGRPVTDRTSMSKQFQ